MYSKRCLIPITVLLLSVTAVLLAVACGPAATPTPTPAPAATATPTPVPTPSPTPTPEEPYKIGALFAVTGFNSPLGEPERNTAVMLEKQINAAGGVNGRKIRIIVYDTESDETKAVTLAKKLLEQDKVLAIIGPTSTGESLALVDTMTKAETPLVSCAASLSITTPIDQRKWIFQTPQNDVTAVGEIYPYLKAKGFTKIAILTASGGFGSTGRKVLEQAAPAAGITIATAESFGDTDTDMTAQLTKIKNSGAQALVVWGTNPGPAIIAKNAKQINLGMPIFNSHGIANKKFIELGGDAVEGVVFPAGKLPLVDSLPASDPQKAVLLNYRASYEKEHGTGTTNTFGGHAYDAIMIVTKALEKSGADKAKLRDEIEKTKNYVGTGGTFNMSDQDHNGLGKGSMLMVQIKNGDWSPAQ